MKSYCVFDHMPILDKRHPYRKILVVTNLLYLLQPFLQRAERVLLTLQFLQAGDQLSCERSRLHRSHLSRQALRPLQGEMRRNDLE